MKRKFTKDSWNREEVKELCRRAYNYGFNGGLYEHSDMRSMQHDCNTFNDWIEENL